MFLDLSLGAPDRLPSRSLCFVALFPLQVGRMNYSRLRGDFKLLALLEAGDNGAS